MATYDRYTLFRENGDFKIVPFGKIEPKDSDFFELYKKNETRLDLLLYKKYIILIITIINYHISIIMTLIMGGL